MTGVINQIVLKTAAHCNLNCTYCYLYNHEDSTWKTRPRLMSEEVFARTLSVIRDYCTARRGHRVELLFHGGEPTLMGVSRFEACVSLANEVLGPALGGIGIQTNGTRLSDRWASIFLRHKVFVGISIDGPPEIHDSVRINHAGRGSYAQIRRGLAILQSAGIQPSILAVINAGISGLSVYDHLRSLDVKRISFLLPDVSHDNKQRRYGGYGPTPVADFLLPIFDAWFGADDADMVIDPFWGLLSSLLGGRGRNDAFGNPLQPYVIIETDGSIEPLDALRVCTNGITKTELNVFTHRLDDIATGSSLLNKAVHEGFRLSPVCQSCAERTTCGGGYLPHRFSRANGFDNPTVWCADILKLLSHIRRRIRQRVH
jgi:uncharacterized protein